MWGTYIGSFGKPANIEVYSGLAGTRKAITLVAADGSWWFSVNERVARKLIGLIEDGLALIDAVLEASVDNKKPS